MPNSTNRPSADNSLYSDAKGSPSSVFARGLDSRSEGGPPEPQSREELGVEATI